MDSIREEEDSRIDYSCLAVDGKSTNSTSRSQLKSSKENTYELLKVFEPGEIPPFKKEEGKKQNSQKSICSIKYGLLILFILLAFALLLVYCYYQDRPKNKINEPAPKQTSVMLLGGYHDDITSSTTIYNSMEKSWKNCNLIVPSTLGYHGAAILNNEIYIFGGYDVTAQESLKSLYKLEADNKWERMADMNEKRRFISQSSIVFNSEIWVIGGSNGKSYLKSVEKYNPKTNTWTEMSELNESRAFTSATIVDGKIYVSGGWDESKTKSSVEVYDPEKEKWEIFTPSMPYAADSHIFIGNHSQLIAIGGDLSKQKPTNQVWKKDVLAQKGEWEVMPYLRQRRYHFGAAIIADELMVFGGSINDITRIDSVEIFDGVEWKKGAPLPKIRGAFASIPLTSAQETYFFKRFCQNS